MIVKNDAQLVVSINGNEVYRKKQRHIQPSEMISFSLDKKMISELDTFKDNRLEVSLIG